jgi:general secretion pathway protein G
MQARRMQTVVEREARGFTLVELLVVVLIVGLLTGIVAPRLLGHIGRSEATAAKGQIDAFSKAVQAYRIDMGRLPAPTEGLQALVVKPGNEPRWRGPYINGEIPNDPWGMPYQYRAPGEQGRDYQIVSFGRDRVAGGDGDDADISN